MATLTHKCPHCLTEHIALVVVASHTETDYSGAIWLRCPKCGGPSSAEVDTSEFKTRLTNVLSSNRDICDCFSVRNFWPTPPKPLIPEHIPEAVARALLQAERNFSIEGNEEAAGTMYRKALDVGLNSFATSPKAPLSKRIDKLTAENVLTKSLQEWAHQIRLIGNESAHDEEPPTREEIISLRSFTNLVMQYLFTLPKMVELAKAADDNAKA